MQPASVGYPTLHTFGHLKVVIREKGAFSHFEN